MAYTNVYCLYFTNKYHCISVLYKGFIAHCVLYALRTKANIVRTRKIQARLNQTFYCRFIVFI